MDVLTDVLRAVRLRSHVYGRFELTAPWGMRLDEGGAPAFHFVSRGSCRLEVDAGGAAACHPVPDGGVVSLADGDFVFLPHGHGHVLRDARDTRAVPVDELVTCSQ